MKEKKDKLQEVYKLIEELGLTYHEVHEGLEDDKMDIYYSSWITCGAVVSELIGDLQQHDLTESQVNILDQIKEYVDEPEVARNILDYLIEEDELEVDGRRILLDNEWYLDHFEYEPETLINLITQYWRDKKISDIGI